MTTPITGFQERCLEECRTLFRQIPARDMETSKRLLAKQKRTSRQQQMVLITRSKSTFTRTKQGTCSTENDGQSSRSQTIALRKSYWRHSSRAFEENFWT